MFPDSVYQKLEGELSRFGRKELQEASHRITQAYRLDENSSELFKDPVVQAAYLAVRMPATFACLSTVMASLSKDHKTFLDLGAGPATGYGVLKILGFSFQKAVFHEQCGSLFKRGYGLWSDKGLDYTQTLHTTPIMPSTSLPDSDLVLMGFFLGELSPSLRTSFLQKAWSACQRTLVIVEPGTPDRFRLLKQDREQLIQQGGHVLAPCPHEGRCPMADSDWCHFSVKVDRTSLHRSIKQVTHPYELEKYSYLVMSKEPVNHRNTARLVRTPFKKTGHLVLDLCTQAGLGRRIVSKKDKTCYKKARKYVWGDLIEEKNI